MKIKLTELLKKITPGKWRAIENKARGAAHKIYSTEGFDIVLGSMTHEDSLIASHAVNVLPELVRASNNFIDCINNFNPAQIEQVNVARQEFEDALTNAEEVEVLK